MQIKPIIKRLLVYLAIFAAVTAASAYVTLTIFSRELNVVVPNLDGMERKEAERRLKAAGLKMKIDSEQTSLDVPKGGIISQDMEPGSRVKSGVEVGVVVSRGMEVRHVPALTDKTVDAAKRLLMAKGVEFNKAINVRSDNVPKGVVIAQGPAAGEWATEPVTLIASSGVSEEVYYCPEFGGMDKEMALRLASELGLKVIEAMPAPAQRLKLNAAARQRIVERGLVPKIEAQAPGFETGRTVVLRQAPDAGMMIKKGDTVYLDFGG